jgi:hypothetical protein
MSFPIPGAGGLRPVPGQVEVLPGFWVNLQLGLERVEGLGDLHTVSPVWTRRTTELIRQLGAPV